MGNLIKTSRRIAASLLALACLGAASISAQAEYPDKPIRIIVPYPPGGTTDLLARAIGPRLEERLKQKVIIENRAGAGGIIGAQLVSKSAPDGYTFVMGTAATHGILPVMQKPAPYDAIKEFIPVSMVASTPNVLAANPSFPARTLADLIALAKAKPGGITYGSTGQGGSPHMSAELLKSMTQIDLIHVPYKGATPMLVDLIGGQIQIGFDNLPSTIAHIRSGKVRALAVTSSKRWPFAPDLPTMAEAGLPGYEVSGWFGLLAPATTPKAVIDLIQKQVASIVRLPEVEKYFLEQGAEPVGNTSEEFGKLIAADLQKWAKVVASTGVKLE